MNLCQVCGAPVPDILETVLLCPPCGAMRSTSEGTATVDDDGIWIVGILVTWSDLVNHLEELLGRLSDRTQIPDELSWLLDTLDEYALSVQGLTQGILDAVHTDTAPVVTAALVPIIGRFGDIGGREIASGGAINFLWSTRVAVRSEMEELDLVDDFRAAFERFFPDWLELPGFLDDFFGWDRTTGWKDGHEFNHAPHSCEMIATGDGGFEWGSCAYCGLEPPDGVQFVNQEPCDGRDECYFPGCALSIQVHNDPVSTD